VSECVRSSYQQTPTPNRVALERGRPANPCTQIMPGCRQLLGLTCHLHDTFQPLASRQNAFAQQLCAVGIRPPYLPDSMAMVTVLLAMAFPVVSEMLAASGTASPGATPAGTTTLT